jgi:hypothetical protein
MISTKEDRRKKAINLIDILTSNVLCFKRTKPKTLPKGINFNNNEWISIETVYRLILNGKDISINFLFDLEEIENKYKEYLFLAKLES